MSIRVIRAGEHIQHIPGWGMTVRESGVAVATSNWWEVPGKTCVAAYQPKGAASYAASKVNLANPGTYDCTAPGAGPSFDTAVGWTFGGWLLNGLTPIVDQTWSAFCAYTNALLSGGPQSLFGAQTATPPWSGFGARSYSVIGRRVLNGSYHDGGTPAAAGVLGFAGSDGYFNGADYCNIGAQTGLVTPMAIGARLISSGVIDEPYRGNIVALAIYSAVLTSTEVAALSIRMAAL